MWLTELFAKKPDEKRPTGDALWSESLLYRSLDFEKYNPDALIRQKGYPIYRRMLLDEQVKAVTRFKRDSVTARRYFFEFEGSDAEEISEDEAAFRIDLFETILRRMSGSFLDALNGIMSGMYHGFSITEKIYRTVEYSGKTWWGLDSLELRPYDTFYFDVDAHGNTLRIVQRMDGKEQDVDPRRVIHYVQNPEMDSHYGQSELRECYRSWFAKDAIIKFQNIFMERHANGFLVMNPKEGKTIQAGTSEYTTIQNILRNLSAATGILLPAELDLKYEQPARTDTFERAVAQHDKAIAKALLVPNLLGISEQGSTGSFAQSQTQLEAFLWTLNSDAHRLEETLNEQLFKDLGDANFGDGVYPVFRFKPLSETVRMQIMTMWKDLITAGAVKYNDADEAYIREMLEFPEAIEPDPEDDERGEEVDPTTALNGAQVTSLVAIVEKVAAGTIPKSTAAQLITTSFPVSLAQAEDILKDVKEKEEPAAPPPPLPGMPGAPVPPPGSPDAASGQEGAGDEAPPPNGDEMDGDPLDDEEDDEDAGPGKKAATVSGRALVTVSSYAVESAMKRVDFTVIGKTTTDTVEAGTTAAANQLADMTRRLLQSLEDEKDPMKIAQLKFNSNDLKKLRTLLSDALSDGWSIGQKNALREVGKAKGEKFANKLALSDEAARAFRDVRSFRMAGNLADSVVAEVSNVLLNGIKGNKAFGEMEKEIYRTLESSGLTTPAEVERVLGTTTQKATAARINTVVRTNVFEAVNEARFATFTDPALEGFVEAFMYSAILDDRTTEICEHLDGRTFATGSEEWQIYNPPNHFNCRSLLIPVTQVDTWKPSEPPTILPQKGFK